MDARRRESAGSDPARSLEVSMLTPIRIGVIGCGGIAGAHLGSIAELPEFALAATCDIDIDRARRAAEEHGAAASFADYRELLATDADAVSICLPHHLHREVSVAASAAGKHVLCEKPMATSLADADAMIAAAEAAQKVLMIGQVLRFRPANIRARELVLGGAIGEVKQVIRRRYGLMKRYDNAPWSADPKQAGGWVLYGFGSHEADQVLFLTGSEATTVYARGETNNPHWGDTDEISMLFGLSRGGFATELHSANCPFGTWDCLIIGGEGALSIESEGLRLDEEFIHLPLPPSAGMTEQFAEFAAAICEDREPEASGRSVRPTMALLEAAGMSIRSGEIIDARLV
jgi:predicted dehydrogenase